jgi:hypothetical protein
MEAKIAYERLHAESTPEGEFDTGFWDGYDEQRNWQYDGKIYRGNDVNYLGIGMYEAHKGVSDPTRIVKAWKAYHYFSKPSDEALYWTEKGYKYYKYFQSQDKCSTKTGVSSTPDVTPRRTSNY